MENKISGMKHEIRLKDEAQARLLEDQKEKRELFMRSFSNFENNFEKHKQILNKDLDAIEKKVKFHRRKQRHTRAKIMKKIRNQEQEIEDFMSSGDERVDTNNSIKRLKQLQREKKHKKTKQNEVERNVNLKESDSQNEEEAKLDTNLPRMALGGVIINENGDPIEKSVSVEWKSEFEDSSNSLESSGFLEFAKNHEAYKEAEGTVQKSVL